MSAFGLANFVSGECLQRIGIPFQPRAGCALRGIAVAGVATVRHESFPAILGIARAAPFVSRGAACCAATERLQTGKPEQRGHCERDNQIGQGSFGSSLYVGCVTVSSKAGWPRSIAASARLIAGPTSFGSVIGPSCSYSPCPALLLRNRSPDHRWLCLYGNG